jgi:DNA-binding response OmpR family regulator
METLKVLIIEDDVLIGMLLTEMLEELGHHVCATALTEDDAVREATRCKPSLMIVDEQLLEGSGMSAVERILRTGPVPCVFISGADVRRPGATALQKPFLEADLVRAIRNVVGGANAPGVPKPSSRCVPLITARTCKLTSSQHLAPGRRRP